MDRNFINKMLWLTEGVEDRQHEDSTLQLSAYLYNKDTKTLKHRFGPLLTCPTCRDIEEMCQYEKLTERNSQN